MLKKGDLVEHIDRHVDYEPLTVKRILLGIVVKKDERHEDYFKVYWYTTHRLQAVYRKNLKLYEERK